MKRLKKVVSLMALVVLIGTDFLNPISYALEDQIVDFEVAGNTSLEVEGGEDLEETVEEESVNETNDETDDNISDDIENMDDNDDKDLDKTDEIEDVDDESGEDEVFEETVEGVTGAIVEELTGEIVESTGTGEGTVIEEIKYNEEPITGEKTYNDVTIRVEALTGIFPEGTELAIKPIKWWNLSSLKDKLVEEKEEIKEDTTIVAFDITFKYEGEEVQPKDGEKVKVIFDYSRNENLVNADKNKNQEVKVYHIEDKDEEGNKVAQGEEKVVDVTNKQESAEDGIVVADAESFSIYAVTVNNVSYNIEYSDVYETKYIIGDDYNNGQSCSCSNSQDCETNCSHSFTYGTITIPVAGGDDIVIMDRNLGAASRWDGETAVTNSSDFIGYHYQWGNDYGFYPTVTPAVSSSQVVRGSGSYSSSTFIIDNYLWNYDATTSDDWTQGPCPSGWHVPSSAEWQAVGAALNAGNDVDGFLKALLLPSAGNRYYYDDVDWMNIGDSNYWTSTPNPNYNDMAYHFESYNGVLRYQNSDGRSYGYSVRCFKNEYVPPITSYLVSFDANRGTFADTPAAQTVTGGYHAEEPQTHPELPGYIFTGWYLTGAESAFDFSGTVITGDITLYAHWDYVIPYGELDVYMIDSNKDLTRLVMMDRNLGASVRYDRQDLTSPNFSSLGYVYQWGNNWGFERCEGPNETQCHGTNTPNLFTTSQQISGWEGYVPSKYASKIFHGSSSKTYNGTTWIKASNGNYGNNLWGYETLTDEARQGPCPDDYYLPLGSDYGTLYTKWKDIRGYNNLSTDGEITDFTEDFLFPLAGSHKKGRFYEFDKGVCADYWTISLYGTENTKANNFWFCKDGKNNYDGKGYKPSQLSVRNNGSTVRCFKDPGNANLTIDAKGGKQALITVIKEGGVSTIDTIVEPTKKTTDNIDLIFGGWYTSPNFEPSTMKTGGDTLSASVTALYAKWDCPDDLVYNSNNQCVSGVLVRFMDGETEYTRSLVLSGDEVSAPVTNPEKSGYIFTGWFEAGADSPFVFTGTPITGNLDLYAHWDATGSKVTVNYYLKDLDKENNVLIDSRTEYVTGVEFTGVTDSVISSIETTYGTGIDGYEYSKSIVYGPDFPGGVETGSTIILGDGSRVIEMYYIPEQNQFTLNTAPNTNTNGSSANGMYYYGAKVTLSGSSSDDCYSWSGWNGLPEGTTNSAQTEFYMPDNSITVTSSVKENTYNIIFNGNESTSGSMLPMNGVRCTESIGLTLNAFEKSGHTFTGWSLTLGGLKQYIDGQTVSGLSKTDLDDVILYAVWDINKYDVSANVETGQENMGYLSGATATGTSLTGLYEYGTELIFIAVPELGYLFDYWKVNGSVDAETGNQLTVVVNQILDIIAFFKPDIRTVTVNHYQENIGGGYTLYETEDNFTGYVDSEFTAIEKEYSGFVASESNIKTITISGDTSRNIINLYYDRQSYNLKYYVDGVQTGSIEPYYYGQSISSREKPTKEGYTFSGWDNVPSIMPAHDVNIYGEFIVNKHLVRFYDDHHDDYNGKLILTGEYAYGTPGTSIVTPNGSGLSKTGNTFSGWIGIPDYMPDHDVDVEAYWTLNSYTIRIKDQSGAVIKSGTYRYGLPVTLECPGMEWEREGYMMTGCLPSMIPSLMPDHDMDIIVSWLPIERNIEVHYYEMDTDGNYSYMYDAFNYTGLTESTFYVPDYTKTGFNFDYYVLNGYTGYSNSVSLVVSGNESANTVDVYYERERYYVEPYGRSEFLPEVLPYGTDVNFVNISPNNQPYYKYYYGEEITLEYLHPDGWNFSGWYDATSEGKGFPPDEMSLTSRNFTFHMPAHNVWVEPIMEHIPYVLSFTGYEGAEIISYEECSYGLEDRVVYYNYSTCLPKLEKDGYWFNGWKDEYGNFEWHTGDPYPGNPVLVRMPNHDYELIADFSPRTNMPYEKHYYLQDVEGTGYTLSGGLTYLGSDGVTDQEIPGRYQYADINGFEYTGFGYSGGITNNVAMWPYIKATGESIVDLYYDRKVSSIDVSYDNGIMSVLGTGYYRYEAPVTLTVITKTGYQFMGFSSPGWYPEYDTGDSVTFPMPEGGAFFYANSQPIEYSIEYELNGGDYAPYSNYQTGYTVEDYYIYISDPIKTGYTFLGWTGGVINGEQLDTLTTGLVIPQGSVGNRKYYANWGPDEVNVTVNYYLKKIDPENNVLTGGFDEYISKGVVYPGLTDSVVDIATLYGTGIEGYEYSTSLVYGSDLSGGVETGTTTILGDGSRVIDMYYVPKKYNFTVIVGQNTDTLGTSISTGYYYGATITLNGSSTDDCFEWDKWGSQTWPEGVENESHTTFAMPAHNVTVESMVSEKSYNIIFNGNGSTTGEMSTLSVQCTTGTLSSNNFERNGYTFTGWSRNSDGPVEFIGESDVHRLSTESGGNVTLYAVWDVNHYTVTFDLDGGSLTGDMALTTDYTIETPAISLTGYIPFKSGYIFTGWYRGESLVNSIAGGETGNYTLTANWKADYVGSMVIDFLEKLDGTYDTVWHDPMLMSGKVDSFFEAPITSYEGFYFDAENSSNVTGIILSWDIGQNELHVYYKRAQYPVEVRNIGEGISSDTSGSADYLYEQLVTISVTPYTGWEFINWTLIDGTLSGVNDLTQRTLSFNMPAGPVIISPNLNHIKYTVSFDAGSGTAVTENQTYYYDDVLSGLDSAVTTRTGYDFSGWYLSGVLYTSGSIMPAENITLTAEWTPKTGIEYQVNHRGENIWDNNYTTLLSGYKMYGTSDAQTIASSLEFKGFTLSGNVEQGIVNPDGTTVVDIYYNRNIYTITLDNNGGTGVTAITGKYETSVTQPSDPERIGYTFKKWDPVFPNTMPAENITITALWTAKPDTPYTVNYYIEKVDLQGEYEFYTGIIYTGQTNSTTPAPLITLTGFETPAQQTGTILPEGMVIEYRYMRKSYELSYDTAGGTPISPKMIRYEDRILTGNTTKTGYNLTGWDNMGDGKMPAGNLKLVALWDPDDNTKYTVNHYLQSLTSDDYVFDKFTILSGTTASGTNAAPIDYPGFTPVLPINQGIINADGTTEININYNRNKYTIIYEMDGGDYISPSEVKYGADLSSVLGQLNPHKQGYNFIKWNGLPDGGTMPAYNFSLIATWETSDDIEYRVEYYKEKLQGGYDVWTGIYTGETDSLVQANVLSFTGFIYDSGNEGNVTTGNIAGDGSLVLKLYYSRNKYLITFVDGDGNTIQSGMVAYEDMPGYTGDTPTKTADVQYSYTFNDTWEPTIESVTTGAIYTAQFDAITNSYTATITSNNTGYGDVIPDSVTGMYGDSIVISGNELSISGQNVVAVPRESTDQYTYMFSGWNNTCGDEITGNCTITAEFTRMVNKYLIIFVDGDGNTIQSGMVEYGTDPVYTGDTPTKTATAQYSYTFNDMWEPTIESVTTGATYTAQFDSTENSYTIDIVSNDASLGTISTGEITVVYGSPIVESGNKITIGGTEIEATPNEPDVQYTYEFDSWTNTCGSELVGNCTIQANFRKTVNSYTITWKNEDGSVIDTTTVKYGVVPTHAMPTKDATGDYIYVFAGWTPEPVAVVGDAEYTAVFTAEEKEKPSKGSNMSGGGGKSWKNIIDSDDQHGSAEENSDGFTGDNSTGDIDNETLSLYEWARQNDITTMDTLEYANPEGLLTRGHMAKMVVNFAKNVLGRDIPTIYPDKCNWNDKESAWESLEIKDYAKKACALGLMGIYVDEFMPNKILDRAEFGTIISRLLWGDRYNIIDTDHRSYYEDHLRALKKQGILTQTDNPEERWEIRKWVWLVFRRISEKLKK